MTRAPSPSTWTSPDGCRIAYDVVGEGEPLVLLHAAGRSRQDWHDAGYTDRLAATFQVISVDLRGSGESDKPVDAASYAIDAMTADVLGVADACGAQAFRLWGFSFGANVGRYLAARSDRVSRFLMGGIPFGSATPGAWGDGLREMVRTWRPILDAARAGTLDRRSLTAEDQAKLDDEAFPVWIAIFEAMLGWPAVEARELRCDTMLLVGSESRHYQDLIRPRREALRGTRVRLEVVPGLDHAGEFTEIDTVLPVTYRFLTAE